MRLTSDQVAVMYRGNFTKRQAALYLGKSIVYIQDLINKGKLRVNLANGSERISRKELEKLIEETTI